MFLSRFLASVCIANILTFSVCNVLKTSTDSLTWIYPTFLFASLTLVFSSKVRKKATCITKGMVVWMIVFWVALTMLRLPYPLEWIPGNQVIAQGDDYARLAELVSMTLSENYPLEHPSNQQYLLSFYYTSLYPMAWLKKAFPLLTLKDAIFLGNSFYHLLLLLSILEIGALLLPSRRSMWTMVVLCTTFGGLDWLADVTLNPKHLIEHHEWWQVNDLVQGNAQISSYFTALWWVVHHFVAAYALVLAWTCSKFWVFRKKSWRHLSAGLLCIAGFYSSPFAAIPAGLFGIIEFRTIRAVISDLRVVPVLVAVFVSGLPLFSNRVLSNSLEIPHFRYEFTGVFSWDKLLSFPLWLVLILLVEFCFIPLLACIFWRRFSAPERKYFVAAWIFLISTYWVSFEASFNYSMRGMLIPCFVFWLLFSRYVPHSTVVDDLLSRKLGLAAVASLALLVSIGTLLEMATISKRMLLWSSRGQLLVMRLHAEGRLPGFVESSPNVSRMIDLQGRFGSFMTPDHFRSIARDPSTNMYAIRAEENSRRYFNAEKFVDVPPDRMARWEKEILRER